MKILVIDDSFTSRKVIKQALSEFIDQEYELIEAENGQQGFDLIKENESALKLVITDINMPVKNGIEMLEDLKKINLQAKFPIVAISTEINDELKVTIKDLGVIAWLLKPVTRNGIKVLAKQFL